MADVAPPPAAAVINGVDEKKKPEYPDEKEYESNLKRAEKDHADARVKFDEARARLDIAQPNKQKDSPAAKKRQELFNQLDNIKQKQSGGKAGRAQVFEQMKRLDEKLKSRAAEDRVARNRLSYKTVDEIDREIEYLERQVNGGMMKLVDERKALAEMSNLRKQRKAFAGFDETQKVIDDIKSQIKVLKDSLDDPEAKALREKYDEIQAELAVVKAAQEDAYKNISALREERENRYREMDGAWQALMKVKEDYQNQVRACRKYENDARQRARERVKKEQEALERERKKERAEKLLAEAQDPAYMDEIRRAESLLHYLDPTSITTTTAAPLLAPSGLSAVPQRTVDGSDIKGTRVVRKDEREETYFMGSGGKKGKKGRKGAADSLTAAPLSSGKFSCPPAVMENCNSMGIDPPMSAAEIATVVGKVKAKLTQWRNDQKAQTERNVAKAMKEIARLDAEDLSGATPTTNGHAKKETVAAGEAASPVGEKVSQEEDASETIASLALEDKE